MGFPTACPAAVSLNDLNAAKEQAHLAFPLTSPDLETDLVALAGEVVSLGDLGVYNATVLVLVLLGELSSLYLDNGVARLLPV